MAHKKGAGSTKNGRDSNAKRLGAGVLGQWLMALTVWESSSSWCSTPWHIAK